MDAGAVGFARWERAIEAGNAAFEKEEDAEACMLYTQAIVLAHHLLASKPWQQAGSDVNSRIRVFDAAVAAFVVSHHNAANLQKRSGTHEDVAALYRQAHLTVSNLSVAADLEEALRSIAARHITRTLGEFTCYLQSCGALAPTSAPASGTPQKHDGH